MTFTRYFHPIITGFRMLLPLHNWFQEYIIMDNLCWQQEYIIWIYIFVYQSIVTLYYSPGEYFRWRGFSFTSYFKSNSSTTRAKLIRCIWCVHMIVLIRISSYLCDFKLFTIFSWSIWSSYSVPYIPLLLWHICSHCVPCPGGWIYEWFI